MAEQPPPMPSEDNFSPSDKASLVHLGQMMGSPSTPFDDEVRARLAKHEANAEKMRSASRGENLDIGPGQFEAQQTQQGQALDQQQALQSAAQAQQAQKAEVPLSPGVEAPGPQGETKPYPAQKGKG